jgi:mannitol/fructose-specific phosphotransferase system IIA component (Ntr-type)
MTADDGTLILLDVEQLHFGEALEFACAAVAQRRGIQGDALAALEHAVGEHVELGPTEHRHGAAVVHVCAPELASPHQVLLRFTSPIDTHDREKPTWFLWLLLGPADSHPGLSTAAEFTHLLEDATVHDALVSAATPEAVWAVYNKALERDIHPAEHHIPPELRRTGVPFGGILADIRRRLPLYGSDLRDGLNTKTLSSVFFLFFACLAPAVAFGGLLSVLTDGQIGAIEMIVATTVCGIVYAIFSGQPLTILGSTGPVIIFMGILYSLTESLGIPYMPTLAWVGLWTSVFLIVLAVTDASSLIRYFTRFTDDTFAALISIIFIVEALKDIGSAFTDGEVSHATALLSTILALGTYQVATALSRARRSVYLVRAVRQFLADFGPTIAIGLMTAIAFLLHEVELETLAVPTEFRPTSDRGWLVNPLEAPTWVWGASALPAVLVSILLYLDQNITVRLVNAKEHKLKKGAGYHLDLLVVGVLVGVCSIFGLPWMVAATVRSLNHVKALANVETVTDSHGVPSDHVQSVVETRVSALAVHLLIGGSLLVLPLLKLVPMSVLFGLFLYMGVASMGGNQLFERVKLWVRDPKLYPPTSYLRAVPKGIVHKFTAIQLACLVVLWVVKASVVGILFPLFIALLVPVRLGLERLFKPEHLALLDSEEEVEDAEDRIAA